MKKYKNLVKLSMLTAIVAMLASCEQKEVEPTTNQEDANLITYENLEVKLPEGIEEGVLSMELADLQNRFYELNPAMKLKAAAGNMEISLTEMDELVSAILSKYPNTFDLSEEDRSMIKEDFVKVDDHMIVEHREVIEKYYSAIIKYELINVLAEYQPKSSGGDDYLGTGLNQKEFWLLAGNPGMVGPTKDASYKAIDLTKKYYPTGSHYRNKADAFRHAIWNALIAKYVGKKKNTVSKCTDWAKKFTDAHEAGASKPDNLTQAEFAFDQAMDYHNNKIGRVYFKSVAKVDKRKWYQSTIVVSPSETKMANAIKAKADAAKKVTSKGQISSYPNNLVHIK